MVDVNENFRKTILVITIICIFMQSTVSEYTVGTPAYDNEPQKESADVDVTTKQPSGQVIVTDSKIKGTTDSVIQRKTNSEYFENTQLATQTKSTSSVLNNEIANMNEPKQAVTGDIMRGTTSRPGNEDTAGRSFVRTLPPLLLADSQYPIALMPGPVLLERILKQTTEKDAKLSESLKNSLPKENLVTVDFSKYNTNEATDMQLDMIAYYSWILIISLAIVSLLIYARQRHRSGFFWYSANQSLHQYSSLSSAEEGKSLVKNVYS